MSKARTQTRRRRPAGRTQAAGRAAAKGRIGWLHLAAAVFGAFFLGYLVAAFDMTGYAADLCATR